MTCTWMLVHFRGALQVLHDGRALVLFAPLSEGGKEASVLLQGAGTPAWVAALTREASAQIQSELKPWASPFAHWYYDIPEVIDVFSGLQSAWESPALTVVDLSRWLGVSESTVRRRADRGELPCVRSPGGQRLFPLEDLRSAGFLPPANYWQPS